MFRFVKPLDYEPGAGTLRDDVFVEGVSLWVPNRARLPALCIQCGQRNGLAAQAYPAVRQIAEPRFTYYLCGPHASAAWKRAVTRRRTLFSAVVVSLVALPLLWSIFGSPLFAATLLCGGLGLFIHVARLLTTLGDPFAVTRANAGRLRLDGIPLELLTPLCNVEDISRAGCVEAEPSQDGSL